MSAGEFPGEVHRASVVSVGSVKFYLKQGFGILASDFLTKGFVYEFCSALPFEEG